MDKEILKEELELYKELQPYFPQDWQVGDHGFCLPCKEYFIATQLMTERNQSIIMGLLPPLPFFAP